MRTTSSDGTSAAAGTSLDAAITSPERVIRGKVEVNWDKNGISGSQYYGQVPSFDDTFTGGSLDPRWALAGTGAAFDSVNHQVVLPNIIGTNTGAGSPQTTTGGTSLTLAQNFDMHGATLRFKFTMPTLTSTTRRMDIYIVDRDTGDYWYARQDSGGLYVQTYNFGTVAPLSKVATWQNANTAFVTKQIDLVFYGDCNPTATFTSVSAGTFLAIPFGGQFPTPPPRLNNCRIVITSFSTAAEAAASTTIQEVLYTGAKNNDDMTSAADKLEIDRSLQGTLPDQVQIVEGSSTAQITTDIVTGETADERQSAAWKLSPFNASSPLYNSPVLGVPVRASIEVETPAGTKKFQKAIGTLQELDVDVNAGTGPLTAFDYRGKLAGSVQLPAIDGDAYGLNASALVDYALASQGVNMGPPIQAGAQLWAPMHGSAYPMISASDISATGRIFYSGEAEPIRYKGFTATVSSAYRPKFTSGPFYSASSGASKGLVAGGSSLLQSAYGYSSSITRVRFKSYFTPDATGTNDMFSRTNCRGTAGFWVKGDAFTATPMTDPLAEIHLQSLNVMPGNSPAEMFIRVDQVTRQAQFWFRQADSGNLLSLGGGTVPTDNLWHWVSASWDGHQSSGANMRIYIGVDGVMTSWLTAAGAWDLNRLPLHDTWDPNTNYQANLPVAELQAYPTTGASTNGGYTLASSFIQNAYLDYSTLELAGNYDTSVREVWSLVNEIAATEYSASFWDEDGVYNYRTRARLGDTTHQSVQRTIDENSIKTLKISGGLDTVKNVVTTNVQLVSMIRNTVVFSTTDTYILLPNQKTRITFQFPNPVSSMGVIQWTPGVNSPCTNDNNIPWPDSGWSTYGVPHGMFCVRTSNSGGSIVSIPDPSIVYGDSNSITLEFINPTTNTLYIVNDGKTVGFGGYTQFSSATAAMQFWGNPSVMLVGDMMVKGATVPVTYTNSASVAQYGKLALPLNDSQWLQDVSTAYGVSSSIAGMLGFPIPTIDMTMVGDPRLQLEDRVKLTAGGVGNPVLNNEFWIQGITDTITPDGGYEQHLVLRMATKKLLWATAKTDTQYGFFDNNSSARWDRYVWG